MAMGKLKSDSRNQTTNEFQIDSSSPGKAQAFTQFESPHSVPPNRKTSATLKLRTISRMIGQTRYAPSTMMHAAITNWLIADCFIPPPGRNLACLRGRFVRISGERPRRPGVSSALRLARESRLMAPSIRLPRSQAPHSRNDRSDKACIDAPSRQDGRASPGRSLESSCRRRGRAGAPVGDQPGRCRDEWAA